MTDVLRKVIDKWQWGGWADIAWPSGVGVDRLAIAQRVTDWFRGQAAVMADAPGAREMRDNAADVIERILMDSAELDEDAPWGVLANRIVDNPFFLELWIATSGRTSESTPLEVALGLVTTQVDDWSKGMAGETLPVEEEIALIQRLLLSTGRLHEWVDARLEQLAEVIAARP